MPNLLSFYCGAYELSVKNIMVVSVQTAEFKMIFSPLRLPCMYSSTGLRNHDVLYGGCLRDPVKQASGRKTMFVTLRLIYWQFALNILNTHDSKKVLRNMPTFI